MSVAEKIAREVDLLQLLLQTAAEHGRAVEALDGEKSTDQQLAEFDRTQSDLMCMCEEHRPTLERLSDLFKSLRNRRYDMGIEALVERIQSKES